MSLRRRVIDLEGQTKGKSNISWVALDLPDRKPDLVCENGTVKPCADGLALLARNPDDPIKVYFGFDPGEV